jgi:hypothetical protein
MPPKRAISPSTAATSNGDLAAQIAELASIIKGYAERFDRLENLLTETRKENASLKTALHSKDGEILKLKEKINDQEQYVRGWSMRILGLKIPQEDATDPEKVMLHVFKHVLEPIFQGALAKKLVLAIPTPYSIIETAHILPAKKDSINPIIVRFYTRNIRNMLFRLKREFAPKSAPSTRAEPGRYLYPFFEDLTRINFDKLKAISAHPDVQSCWSVGGVIRYKLKNSDVIKKVKSVFASVEAILKS